ncbi:MAG: enoyl-CoA hydratase [Myxococcaceae bacterium]|nr:enoyl-CoA hydratase [Myxococcaceae bacterium]
MTTQLIDDIETSRDGGTLVVKFARPAKKNALTIAMYERLNAALAEAASDVSVRAVVFASTGETFTAGNDLGDFMQNPPTGESSPVFQFISALSTFEKPLLAAVDGKAIGLGLTMLLHCDFVYATDRASLVAPFVNLGLVPEAASSLLLPRLLGHVRAAEVLLLGQPITAAQAHAWGLVNALVTPDQVLPKALATAKLLAERAPTAVRLSKRLMKDAAAVKARMAEEGALFVQQLQSPEVAEAIGAFFEKRTPDFSKF